MKPYCWGKIDNAFLIKTKGIVYLYLVLFLDKGKLSLGKINYKKVV